MLAYNTTDSSSLIEMLEHFSSYIKLKSPFSPTLRSILEHVGGTALLTHTIEPITLPTWHYFPHFPDPVPQQPNNQTDPDYTTLANFMVEGPTFEDECAYPLNAPPSSIPALYLVNNPDPEEAESPYTFKIFNPETDVAPDVFMVQPYGRNENLATVSMTLGIKIEVEEIDGVTIPTLHHSASLSANNSHFLHGSIPLSRIRPNIFSATAHRNS